MVKMVKIVGGSEKEQDWAKKIVAAWIEEMKAEIDGSEWRAGTPHEWLIAANKEGLEKLISGLDGKTAKETINFHIRGGNPVRAIKKWVLAQQPKPTSTP